MPHEFAISRADELIDIVTAAKTGKEFDYIISLEHPGAEHLSYVQGRAPRLHELAPQWAERQLILTCYDLETDNGAFKAPGRAIVEAAIAHDNRWGRHDGTPTRALIHCRSGKARSTALALVLLRKHMGVGSERAALDEVLRIRPVAAPNIAIVCHGDDILGCDGRLVAVVEQDAAVTDRRLESERRRLRQIESGRIGTLAI